MAPTAPPDRLENTQQLTLKSEPIGMSESGPLSKQVRVGI